MSNDANCESPPSFTVSVKLTGSAIESMRCLFLHGPTWDGNIPSKSGRDELFDLKLAGRINGWSWLTADGMRLALNNGMDRDKDRWERDRRRKLIKLDEIERILLPADATGQAQCGQQNGAIGLMGAGRQTVEGLERLLKPESDGHV
jgi:hypothetical protein